VSEKHRVRSLTHLYIQELIYLSGKAGIRMLQCIEYSHTYIVQTKCVRYFLTMHHSSSSAHSVMSLINFLIRTLCVLHAKSLDIVGKVCDYKTKTKKQTQDTTNTIKLGFQHSRKKERKINRRKQTLECNSILPLVTAVLITPKGAEPPGSRRIGVIGALVLILPSETV